MIRKIRSYLLSDDNQDGNDNSSWIIIVAIILFSPTMFFELYKFKRKNIVAKVEGIGVSRKAFQVTNEENRIKINEISRVHGKKMAEAIEKIYFGNKSIEEFSMEKELRKAYLNFFNKKNLNKTHLITDKYIQKKIFEKNEKIAEMLGFIVYGGLTNEKNISEMLNSYGISNNILDKMAEFEIINLFMEKILNLNLSILEKSMKVDFENIKNLEFVAYSISEEKIKKEIKKVYNNDFFWGAEGEKILERFYLKEIESEKKYKSEEEFKIKFFKFNIPEGEREEFLKFSDKSIEELKKKFKFVNEVLVDAKRNKETDSLKSMNEFDLEVLKKGIKFIDKKINEEVFIHNENGYLLKLESYTPSRIINFKNIKNNLIDDFIKFESNKLLKEKIESIRKEFDKNGEIKVENYSFIEKIDLIKSNKVNEEIRNIIVEKKKNFRKNSVFINNEKFIIGIKNFEFDKKKIEFSKDLKNNIKMISNEIVSNLISKAKIEIFY